jgi:hypothetical protein
MVGSNADSLISTGFVNWPVPNPWDHVLLEIEIKEDDPLFKVKLELIN